MADYRMPLAELPGHVLAKILCDVAESETEMGLVELLEARGYGTLLLFLNASPGRLNWLAYVNTRTWVRLVAETTVVPVARDVAELRYTYRVHDLCDLARPTTGGTATTARALLQRLRASGAYAAGSPQATLLEDGIAGNPRRYPPVPPRMPRDASGVRTIDFRTLVGQSARTPDGGQYGPLEVWDTRNVTAMRGAFQRVVGELIGPEGAHRNRRGLNLPTEPRALDLAFWDTRRVTDMAEMFENMTRTWTVTGLRNWNTRSVINMSFMFRNCVWTPDVEDWVTSSVRDASSMFECEWLEYGSACNPDVSRWDTRVLENAEKMFMNLVRFDRDLSRWDTRRLRIMSFMFLNARSFLADISEWDTQCVTEAERTFDGCPIPESHKPRVSEHKPSTLFTHHRSDSTRLEFRFVDGKLQFV